jgi:hypothetical protein
LAVIAVRIGNEDCSAHENQSLRPKLQPALLRLSAMISQDFGFTASFPRRVFGKRDRHAKSPRLDRA